MKWELIGAALGGLTSFIGGTYVGYKAYQHQVNKKMEIIAPLLTNTMVEAVYSSFEDGMTKEQVLEKVLEDLKFIEQVV